MHRRWLSSCSPKYYIILWLAFLLRTYACHIFQMLNAMYLFWTSKVVELADTVGVPFWKIVYYVCMDGYVYVCVSFPKKSAINMTHLPLQQVFFISRKKDNQVSADCRCIITYVSFLTVLAIWITIPYLWLICLYKVFFISRKINQFSANFRYIRICRFLLWLPTLITLQYMWPIFLFNRCFSS